MDARNMPEYLRIGRPGREYAISDVMHKIWLCKANGNTGVLYLPRCIRNATITINECNLEGELIGGMVITASVRSKTIVGVGLKALGKRFKITKVISQSLPYDHRQLNGQLNTQEVPKDGGRAAEEPSPDSREGL